MNKRLYGMAPGGRMALDKVAQRRRVVWHTPHKQTRVPKKGKKNKPSDG